MSRRKYWLTSGVGPNASSLRMPTWKWAMGLPERESIQAIRWPCSIMMLKLRRRNPLVVLSPLPLQLQDRMAQSV